jgi:hypothetical protein
MENAKLGDAMIEKLRAHGTAAEKEKIDVMERLQEQAMALKAEQEEKLKLHMDAETLKAMAAAAEVRPAAAWGVGVLTAARGGSRVRLGRSVGTRAAPVC